MNRIVKSLLFWPAIVIVLLVVLLPILWIYVTAFKGPDDIYAFGLDHLFVFKPTLENFKHIFEQGTFVHEIVNTAIISIASTILVMAVSLPAAYSFARWNPGGGHLLFITISTRMFPAVVAAIPYFFLYKTLNLSDTHIGLILLYLFFNMSFATFLLYGFFREISVEMEQAAMVDGYSRFAVFRKVVLPLILPGIAVTAVFCLIFSWNEFLYALLFTRTDARTLSLGISAMWGAIDIQWGPMCAAIGLGIIPTVVASLLMQRYIIRGLTFGAVKG